MFAGSKPELGGGGGNGQEVPEDTHESGSVQIVHTQGLGV